MENDYDEPYDDVTRRVERCDKRKECTIREKRLATPGASNCAKLLKGFNKFLRVVLHKRRFAD